METGTEIVIAEPLPGAGLLREIEALADDQIEKRFAEATLRTAHGLLEMAACVRVLENRGHNLSGLKMAILPYLRLIAHGQLMPELVLRFAASPSLLAAAARLPMPDQKRLIDKGVVPMAVIEADRSIGIREVDPRVLSRRELSRVFGETGLVPPNQQIVAPHAKRSAKRRVRVDGLSRTVWISNTSAPLADFLSAMANAAGRQGDIDRRDVNGPSVGARLTEEERDRLRAACKAMRLDEAEFVRRAILTWLI
jgi:hypothetical protein